MQGHPIFGIGRINRMNGTKNQEINPSFYCPKKDSMNAAKNIILHAVLSIYLLNNLNAQSINNAQEDYRVAEEFRKNLKPDSAVIYYERAAAGFERTQNTDQLIATYNHLGIILTRQDKYQRAKEYLDKALSRGLSSTDTNSLAVARTYISLGVVYNALEQYEQSLKHHFKALFIRISRLGENDAEVATSYGNLGNVYLNKKEFDKSLEMHLKAMTIREKLYGEKSVEITQSYYHLGNVYREKMDYKTSVEYFQKALDNKITQLGEKHKDLARYYKSISDVYYLMKNKEQGDLYKTKSEKI